MDKLVERLARGDREAFAELYDAYADRLHHYLTVRLGSRADADDVLQETFVRLTRSRRSMASVTNLVAYVFAAARNEASRYTSRRVRYPNTDQICVEDLFCENSTDPIETRETSEQIAAALAKLGAEEREVVQLKIYAGLTFREIAEVTQTPQGTVATRYRTALARLGTWLKRDLS